MRKEPLLTAVPPAPVQSLASFMRLRLIWRKERPSAMAPSRNKSTKISWPVRSVFEVLATRERDRADSLSAACLAACGKRPDRADLRWAPIDLVPAAEIADVRDSSLSTPYTAWALAARHRQRAFVFWTYVIALAEDPWCGGPRRIWRVKRCPTAICCAASGGLPGAPNGRSRRTQPLMTEPTSLRQQRCWRAFSSRT